MSLYDLGVSREATKAEIVAAYRKAAKRHHPDAGGDAAQFQKLQHAYDILSDDDLRQRYDAAGDEAGDTPDNTDAAVKGLLRQGLTEAMADDDQGEADLVAKMRGIFRKGIADSQANLRRSEADARRLRKIAVRFKTKGGARNFIQEMLERDAAGLEDSCAGGRRHCRLLEQALKALDDYSYDRPVPEWFWQTDDQRDDPHVGRFIVGTQPRRIGGAFGGGV